MAIYDCLTKYEQIKREKRVKYPVTASCLGCGLEFSKKSNRHLHCSEACRWKKAVRENTDAAKRARVRSAIWYRNNAEKHKANVSKRKTERCQL